jgi:hypothetical protein
VNLAALAGESALPYWLSLGLTPRTVLTALALATVSATVAGALPAIVITGRAIAPSVGGGSRVRFGRFTGALVVADIAVAVVAVAMAFTVSGHATDVRVSERATGIPAGEYLALELRLPDDAATFSDAGGTDERAARLHARLAADQRALVAAIEREPGVERVAVGDVLPRMEHRSRPFELEGAGPAAGAPRRWTRVARIDADFLDALGTRVLVGRDFERSDTEADARVAIVNTAFVEREFEGGDPIGRRVRFPTLDGAEGATWYEVVGVVGHLGVNLMNAERGEAVYLPAAPGSINPMQLAVHTALPPASLTPRLRALVAEVDPDLAVTRTSVLSEVRQGDWYLVMGLAGGLVLLAVSSSRWPPGLYDARARSRSARETGPRGLGVRAGAVDHDPRAAVGADRARGADRATSGGAIPARAGRRGRGRRVGTPGDRRGTRTLGGHRVAGGVGFLSRADQAGAGDRRE